MDPNGRTERFLYEIFGHFRTVNAPERIAEETVAVILNPAFRIHPTRRFSGRFGTATVYERVCHSSLRQLLVRRSSIGDPRQFAPPSEPCISFRKPELLPKSLMFIADRAEYRECLRIVLVSSG